MIRIGRLATIAMLVPLIVPSSEIYGQFAGSRGGVVNNLAANSGIPAMTPEVVQGFITVDGKAELRVKPTKIRIVIAVSAEADTPQNCQAKMEQKIASLKLGWQQLGIRESDVVDDFIAVLPRFEFDIEKRQTGNVAIEKKSGFLMQSNLHVAVKTDEQAMQVIRVAFSNNVSDIIAFDYWNDQIDEIKKQARAAAIAVAKAKSDTILSVFDKRPALINVAESTQTVFPKTLYESFENSNDQKYSFGRSSRDTPVIRTFRPKNTYYRGLFFDGDLQPDQLPMKSEISVVSTVKLYYESPVAKEYLKLRADD